MWWFWWVCCTVLRPFVCKEDVDGLVRQLRLAETIDIVDGVESCRVFHVVFEIEVRMKVVLSAIEECYISFADSLDSCSPEKE